jgi:hypothetical protein
LCVCVCVWGGRKQEVCVLLMRLKTAGSMYGTVCGEVLGLVTNGIEGGQGWGWFGLRWEGRCEVEIRNGKGWWSKKSHSKVMVWND